MFIDIPNYVNTLVGCIIDSHGYALHFSYSYNGGIYIYNHMNYAFEVPSGFKIRTTLIYD